MLSDFTQLAKCERGDWSIDWKCVLRPRSKMAGSWRGVTRMARLNQLLFGSERMTWIGMVALIEIPWTTVPAVFQPWSINGSCCFSVIIWHFRFYIILAGNCILAENNTINMNCMALMDAFSRQSFASISGKYINRFRPSQSIDQRIKANSPN